MPRSLRSLDAPSQHLHNFTNREKEKESLRRVLDLPEGTPLPVLMFYGVGGNGKSWLLRKLREELPSGSPSALLDLEPLTGGTPYHTDSSRALAELRRQLAKVSLPWFDLAYAWLRYKEGVKDEPLLRGSGAAATTFDFILEAANALASSVPVVNWATWLAKKVAGPVWKRFKGTRMADWLMTQAGQEDFVRLRRMSSQEIYPQLASRLLQDLAEHLPPRGGKACRGILFLDTFEALRLGVLGQAQSSEREAWVRSLYMVDSPLLLVLAGRDQLRWHEQDPGYANPACLEQHLVGGLSEGDARDFLTKCGIADQALQDAVLRVSIDLETTGGDDGPGYHPFSLGLCADTIREETARGGAVDPATFDMAPGDTARLAQRFLKSLSDPAHEIWVKRLALTPRFDEAAARAAFCPNPGAPQDAAWQALRGYSFLRDADIGGWRTLHARMRDALADQHSSAPQEDRFWVNYWPGRSHSETDAFAALSWYHRYRLSPSAARDEWRTLAERLRQVGRMREHYALLGWWEPTGLMATTVLTPEVAKSFVTLGNENSQASLGNRSENLQRAIACYTDALRVRTEADFPQDWAMTQYNLGTAYLDRWRLQANRFDLEPALSCFEAAERGFRLVNILDAAENARRQADDVRRQLGHPDVG